MQADIVLSVDPGREKCGIAVVHRQQGVSYKAIMETADLAAVASKLAVTHNITTVVIGDRTTSQTAQAAIAKLKPNNQTLKIVPVDEHRSTDAARIRYWQENPPKGLKRLIPTTLQVPPVPVDDYVALILAERYFAGG